MTTQPNESKTGIDCPICKGEMTDDGSSIGCDKCHKPRRYEKQNTKLSKYDEIVGRLATQFDLTGSDMDFLSVALDELKKASREDALSKLEKMKPEKKHLGEGFIACNDRWMKNIESLRSNP